MGKRYGLLVTLFLLMLCVGSCSNNVDELDEAPQNSTTSHPAPTSPPPPVVVVPPTTSTCPADDRGCCSSHGGFDPLNCCLNGSILCRDGTLSRACQY